MELLLLFSISGEKKHTLVKVMSKYELDVEENIPVDTIL